MSINRMSFFIILLATSCNFKNVAEYVDASHHYKMVEKKLDHQVVVSYYELDNKKVERAKGSFVNNFRNGNWFYSLDTGAIILNYSYYKDKRLEFETNLLAEADSILHGDWATKFLFNTTKGNIFVTIAVNGPNKDSVPESNFRDMFFNEAKTTHARIKSYDVKLLDDKNNKIFTSTAKVDLLLTGDRLFLKMGFAFLNNRSDFVEITVSTSDNCAEYVDILFNAILTNFYLRGNRLYNPIRPLS